MIKSLSSPALSKFDLVVLMTDHDCFNYKLIYKNSKKIIDCRGKFPESEKLLEVKLLCIIQARSNSRRFPNKALYLIWYSLIQHVINRTSQSKKISKHCFFVFKKVTTT